MTAEWWRSAVIYQIYPRSFRDQNGDGMGDLPGITAELDHLVALGIDAVWLSPFMTSPQKDAGYDVADYRDVDPLFGTLADFDAMLAAAHERGIRVIVDIVPNHCSDQHAWFQQALAAAPGSPDRARFLFRDGRGPEGNEPPNNWESVFGGAAWTRVTEADGRPGQWYLHLFDSTQPDFDWTNPEVRAEFVSILRFWLDRGVDGFRVDVAHGLMKAAGLPDYTPPQDADSMGGGEENVPYWGQPEVHDVYREWHTVLAEYPGDRALCAEAWMPTAEQTALWVRPDEMHQAFNFPYLTTEWDAAELRAVIDESMSAFHAVGAPATWVLSNHDVVRHATRLSVTGDNPQGHGLGPRSVGIPDPAHGVRRARAATAVMLALPGSAYLYQGEELGLPEVIDIPDDARQDPTWFRTNRERYGRDGCRVPIPWRTDAPNAGFGEGSAPWLPLPADWASYARDGQEGDASSTLTMYRDLLRLRRELRTATGELTWLDAPEGALAFRVGSVGVLANLTGAPVPVPAGWTLLRASAEIDGELPADTAAWYLTE